MVKFCLLQQHGWNQRFRLSEQNSKDELIPQWGTEEQENRQNKISQQKLPKGKGEQGSDGRGSQWVAELSGVVVHMQADSRAGCLF